MTRTPYANEILSQFNAGEDTYDIAKRFGISESEAADLLHEARRTGFTVNVKPSNLEAGRKRGTMAAAIARRNKPVTLAALKFLKGSSE